jgi:chaperonin GroEL
MAVAVEGDALYNVARISSNGDETIARIVADAIGRVGKDGVVTVEESRTLETHLEVVTGLQLNSGFLSPYFMTDPQTMKCEYENPMICLWEGNLGSAKALVPLLKIVHQESRPLLLVAGDYENEAIAVLATNRIKNGLQVCAVTTGAFGDRRRELLRDVAALTGATAFTEDMGSKIDNVTRGDLGDARKIIVDQNKSLIMADSLGKFTEGRIAEVRRQMEQADGVEKAHLQARLAGLTGGVAIIKVGAATEVEMKEKKDRAEDAMYAVKAAVEEGIVEGGGMALLRAGQSHAESDGESIVTGACCAPALQICRNAGLEISRKWPSKDGYNAAKDRWEDLKAAGVIDPAKVVIEALKNAVSVAGMILTNEAMVAEVLVENGL